VYVARELSFGDAQPDADEKLQVAKLHFDEVYELAMRGRITDSISLSAIFKLKPMLDNGLI